MSHKKDYDVLRAGRTPDQLKWETAKELGLDDALSEGGDALSVRETGKIGGDKVKAMVEMAEGALAGEGERKAELHLEEGPRP